MVMLFFVLANLLCVSFFYSRENDMEKKQHLMSYVFGDLNFFFLPIFVKFALQLKKKSLSPGYKNPHAAIPNIFFKD